MKMAAPSLLLPYETLAAYLWEINSMLEVFIGIAGRVTALVQTGLRVLHRDPSS
jgi:hypothetical protein